MESHIADTIKNGFKSGNSKLLEIINSYSFYIITDIRDINIYNNLLQNIPNSNYLIINQYKDDKLDDEFYIIGFQKTIIIINLQIISLLNQNLSIYFLPKVKKNNLNQHLGNNYSQLECNDVFLDEINNFNEQFMINQNSKTYSYQMKKSILPCITGYLILESYFKINKNQSKNISFDFQNVAQNSQKEIENQNLKEKSMSDFVFLRNIDTGYFSKVDLVYSIENGELYAHKMIIDEKNEYLLEREYNNYLQINYPLLPKLYCKIKNNNSFIVQFINGKTLKEIEKFYFSKKDKIIIIFQIILTINYLHKHKFIYRDLKPTNIMIDKNKTVFIIDFDRMIKLPHNNDDNYEYNHEFTNDFNHPFAAPEICSNIITDKNDIYSIGQMIYYIMNGKSFNERNDKIEDDNLYSICKKCLNLDSNQRPPISDLIFEYYYLFFKQINNSFISNFSEVKYFQNVLSDYDKLNAKNIDQIIRYYLILANHNHPDANFCIGFLYHEGKCVKKDINKAIHYYLLAVDQNNCDAQFNLGYIYLIDENIPHDINKAIHYFQLAADQNLSDAQYILGEIYENGIYVEKDTNKAIHYYSLAADQNNLKAQYSIGCVDFETLICKKGINKAIHYYTLASKLDNIYAQFELGNTYLHGKYVTQNIDKGIYYLELAANHNNSYAQFDLGLIYDQGWFVKQDINKAIHYYTLAANLNNSNAQFNLGLIYASGEYYSCDIDKVIHYLSLAADQNHLKAQYFLGIVDFNVIKNRKGIEKAIHYYSLAANQNNISAQFFLGDLYYKGIYVKRDINKAIYYFELASNPKSRYNLGSILFQNNNFTIDKYGAIDNTRFHDLISSAAQNILGNIYLNGKYITIDINKAIYYFSLASDHNNPSAQYNLGIIYLNGEYMPYDINKAIHYLSLSADQNNLNAQYAFGFISFADICSYKSIDDAIHYYSLAANQNNVYAQIYLGFLYFEGKYVKRDIKKLINYLELASIQNCPNAQYNLGVLYFKGEYVAQDIKKAIYYFQLAAVQKYPDAQYYLGLIYLKGIYITHNTKKAINYFIQAATQNCSKSQYVLGLMHIHGDLINKDMIKGIDYLIQSSYNKEIKAHFLVGYFYHEGKYVQNDIEKILKYYKEGSSFNDQYAKNNLGIIYKNGFGEKIGKNIGIAISYFEEAIRMKDDMLSMYNLSHIYIYEDVTKDRIDESIKLLVKLSCKYFNPSYDLLCIALIKKNGFNFEKIKKEMNDKKMPSYIYKKMMNKELFDKSIFKEKYQYYQNIDYLYDYNLVPVLTSSLNSQKVVNSKNESLNNITSDFYAGFNFV